MGFRMKMWSSICLKHDPLCFITVSDVKQRSCEKKIKTDSKSICPASSEAMSQSGATQELPLPVFTCNKLPYRLKRAAFPINC